MNGQTVQITGIASEMQGVARLPSGICVFVPGAIPGETVEIEIMKERDRFCEGRVLSLVKASDKRVAPECPYAGVCTGCSAQHIRYDAQSE